MSGKTAKAGRQAVGATVERARRRKPAGRFRRRLKTWGTGAGVFTLGGLLVYLIVATGPHTGTTTNSNGGMSMDMAAGNVADRGSTQYPYAVGDPGVGVVAPEFKLRSTAGGTFDLSSNLGKQPVLLYFQEGLMCQPCWDQVVAIQKQLPAFHALGINTIVTITSNPYDQLKQKAIDEGFSIPVLVDDGWMVSDRYTARRYGMMQGMHDGHTFILVGKDGRIAWRGDYGGPPKEHDVPTP